MGELGSEMVDLRTFPKSAGQDPLCEILVTLVERML